MNSQKTVQSGSAPASKPWQAALARRGVGILTILAGALVLLGWILDIPGLKSILPNFVAMKVNTAIGFILAGLSVTLLEPGRRRNWLDWLAAASALAVLLLGLLTLMEYILRFNFRIDQRLIPEAAGAVGTLSPGRMSPISAVNFILCGLIPLLAHNRKNLLITQSLSLLPGLTGMVGLMAYLYQNPWQIGIGIYLQMALHTSLLFLLLSIGFLLFFPEEGFSELVTGNSPGSWLLKRIVPAAVILFTVMGWLWLLAEKHGVFEHSLGVAFMMSVTLALLTGLIYWTGLSLNRLEKVRSRAERENSEAANQVELMFNHSPGGIMISSVEGLIIRANEWFTLELGYSREDLIGKSVHDIHLWKNPEDRERFIGRLKTHLECNDFEAVFQHKNGSQVVASVSAKFILLHGTPHILSLSRDISAQKQSERIARLSYQTQTLLLQLDNLEAGYALIGQKIHELIGSGYVIVSALDEPTQSTRVVEMFGTAPEQKAILDKLGFDPTQIPFPLQDMPAEALQSYRGGKLELFPGGLYDLLQHKVPKAVCEDLETSLHVEKSYLIGFVWDHLHFGGLVILTGQDIEPFVNAIETLVAQLSLALHRIKVEKELRLQNLILHTQQETSIDGLLIVDENNQVLSCNRRFVEMWEIPPETVAVKDDTRILPLVVEKVANPEEFLVKVKKLYEARTQTSQDELVLKDGRIFERYSAPMWDAGGHYHGRVWYFHDITQSKALHEQLFQAQKMESIGRLASGIAHEINTPAQYVGDNIRFLLESFKSVLTLLNTYEEAFKTCRGGLLPPETIADVEEKTDNSEIGYLIQEVPKAFQQTQEGISRISTIVRAMKDFAHPGKSEKTPEDLNHAIESTATVARNEWKYVADLVTELDPALPPVPCVVNEFNQVILNMVVNSAHSIAEAIKNDKSRFLPSGKGMIILSTRRDGEHAEIRISDTGAGIPDHVRPKIFEPFFTTKPVGQGTGQGLTISRNIIVEKHRGSIDFESETGRGTTFIIRLPISPPPE